MNQNGRHRIGVLFGGRSGEHEVSLMSARTVMSALESAGYQVVPIGITTNGRWLVRNDPLKRLADGAVNGATGSGHATAALPMLLDTSEDRLPPIDLVFPVLHGPYGEDGTVQGLLEMANIPYVGCGVLASATGMDKILSKTVFAAAGLPQTPYRHFLRRAWQHRRAEIVAEVEEALTYPLFVKPANLGSSVGISKAKNHQELLEAVDLACGYDRKILVEQGVEQAREIEVSVLGNDDPRASVPGEVVTSHEFYDYEAKYMDTGSQLLVPAPIDGATATEAQRLAIHAFRTLDCTGLARVDFLLAADGTLFLNEINTMPGFTHASMYPRLWEASGVPLPELVGRLVELALERHQDRQQNRIART